jgi:molecular chaperone IbpA
MHFDLTPLYKNTVGYDRFARLLDTMNTVETAGNGYPPYNIERLDENEYRITMAVAGFSEEDLNIEVKENALTVNGEKDQDQSGTEFLHQGIAARDFERRFQLADFVEVAGAKIENGLLHIDLKREIPEAMKPRTIEISADKGKNKAKTIDQKAA